MSRPSMGPTQPPIQWVSGHISSGRSEREGRHPSHLVLRSRLCDAFRQLLHMASWHAQGQLHIFCYFQQLIVAKVFLPSCVIKLLSSEVNLLPYHMIGCSYGISAFIVQLNSTLRVVILRKLSFNIA
jgi:hypothetical protein